MKVYSYRTFENKNSKKSFLSNSKPNNNGFNIIHNQLFKSLNFFGNQNFVFQLVSICLLTIGLLLGFQTLTETANINAFALANKDDVKALNNFGKNIKPSDNLDLKEINLQTTENLLPSENLDSSTTQPLASKTITYIIKQGDSLYSIAQEYNINFSDIAKDNDLSRPYNLQIGQQLYLNL